MIITKLQGGLGNQMFQAAAGKALALKHDVELKVDTSFLEKPSGGVYTQRDYELHIFKTTFEKANPGELKVFDKINASRFSRKLRNFVASLYSKKYCKENGTAFNLDFLTNPKQTYLDGFWQSERYFSDYSKEIREMFSFNENIEVSCKSDLELISKTKNSVSVHVRRGDYVHNANANAFHGLCSEAYYKEGCRLIQNKQGDIQLFVFSDDIDWCKDNLKLGLPTTYISSSSAAEDMLLMSRCAHHIIANSSFSWWGAWLNSSPHKTVIAPNEWFKDNSLNTKDVIPKTWIRI